MSSYHIFSHAREGGYVIGAGLVSIYVCGQQKKFESYFSDQLTFSNIRGRTSHQIYRPCSTTAFSINAFFVKQIKDFLI